MVTSNLPSDCFDRKIGRDQGVSTKGRFYSHCVRKLKLADTLRGHTGCVNRIAWNDSGTQLASGSDDTRVGIFDYATGKNRDLFPTGHTANIFGVAWLSSSCIVTGAMDFTVRLHESPFGGNTSTTFDCHSGRVKDLAVEPRSMGQLFFSASEDGTVRQFDRRLPHCGCADSRPYGAPSSREAGGAPIPPSSNVLIQLGSGGVNRRSRSNTLPAMSVALSPTDPTYIAVGCGDNTLRVYDRRMLGLSAPSDTTTPFAMGFRPPHAGMGIGRNESHSTHISWSPDGNHLLGSFSNDHIYLFDVRGTCYGDVAVTSYVMPPPPVSKPSRPVDSMKTDDWAVSVSEDRLHGPLELSSIIREAHAAILATDKTYLRQSVPSVSQLIALYLGRASRLTLRKWKGDAYIAAVDCLRGHCLSPSDHLIHLKFIEALAALPRDGAARSAAEAERFRALFPDHIELVKDYATRRRRQRGASNASADSATEATGAGEREGTQRDQSHSAAGEEENEEQEGGYMDDGDDEAEDAQEEASSMRPDKFMEEERYRAEYWRTVLEGGESYGRNGSTAWTSHAERQQTVRGEPTLGFLQRYVGSCNISTDIKEANFFGDSHIAAGSDDGRVLIWERESGKPVHMLNADNDICNSVRPHPFDPCIATSGIESVVKIWRPEDKESSSEEREAEETHTSRRRRRRGSSSANEEPATIESAAAANQESLGSGPVLLLSQPLMRDMILRLMQRQGDNEEGGGPEMDCVQS